MIKNGFFSAIMFSDGTNGFMDDTFVYKGELVQGNIVYSITDDEKLFEHPNAKYIGNIEGSCGESLSGEIIFTSIKSIDR